MDSLAFYSATQYIAQSTIRRVPVQGLGRRSHLTQWRGSEDPTRISIITWCNRRYDYSDRLKQRWKRSSSNGVVGDIGRGQKKRKRSVPIMQETKQDGGYDATDSGQRYWRSVPTLRSAGHGSSLEIIESSRLSRVRMNKVTHRLKSVPHTTYQLSCCIQYSEYLTCLQFTGLRIHIRLSYYTRVIYNYRGCFAFSLQLPGTLPPPPPRQ